jgi:hypothetical protein
MGRAILFSSLSVLLLAGATACTWVELTPAAEGVQVLTGSPPEGCKKVGTTKARTKTSVGIFDRSDAKVAEELATLARNDAPELGGNTVIAQGPVEAEGIQRFDVYDCPRS